VLRYVTGETDDGLSGKEGTFLICSFWLVSALAIVGEMKRASDLMERLLRIASPLGLYAEEFEVDRSRHLGNFHRPSPTSLSSRRLAESSSPTSARSYHSKQSRQGIYSLKEAVMTIEQAVPIRSTIPARLDRLGWSPFHTRMVAGLGAAWILDGLQITISSSVTGVLISPETLGMTSTQVGLIASSTSWGRWFGALIGNGSSKTGWSWLSDRRAIMALGGIIELAFVIKAEGKSLETVTKPLTATAD
jgi:hypothetical protein